jgi:hypothetical protein
LERAGRRIPLPDTPVKALRCSASEPDCTTRLERRRGSVHQRWTDTVLGLFSGLEVRHRASGAGPLTIRLGMRPVGAALEAWHAGQNLLIRRGGATLAAVSIVRATDRNGLAVPTRFVEDTTQRGYRSGWSLRLDDAAARYPLRIDTAVGACPASWCADGDFSTIDVCTDGGTSCTRILADEFRDEPCVWGVFCCLDGIYREACAGETVDPLAPPDAPRETGVRHSETPDPATPPPQPGDECRALWCSDGDQTTLDACTRTDDYPDNAAVARLSAPVNVAEMVAHFGRVQRPYRVLAQ